MSDEMDEYTLCERILDLIQAGRLFDDAMALQAMIGCLEDGETPAMTLALIKRDFTVEREEKVKVFW